MRVFKIKRFQKWAKKSRLADFTLLNAIADLELSKGTVPLGGNLYKVRVASESRGKSAGYRTIITYKRGVRSIFLVGFGKNERANISKRELQDLKDFAKVYLSLSDQDFELAVTTGLIVEIEVESNE